LQSERFADPEPAPAVICNQLQLVEHFINFSGAPRTRTVYQPGRVDDRGQESAPKRSSTAAIRIGRVAPIAVIPTAMIKWQGSTEAYYPSSDRGHSAIRL
jgi:hypothetical protein